MLKILHIVLLASVKYIVTLPYAMIIGLDYEYALLAVLTGGIGGFLFFYYISKPLNRGLILMWPCLCKAIPNSLKGRYHNWCINRTKKKKKRIFTWKNRFISRMRSNYGFWGVIIATPVLLTIPIGAFLANKYYAQRRHIVLYMILSIIGWAGVLSGLVHLFPKVFL
ncbi:hypothetical protein [Draconibacterium halophilum]|uniref:Small multi-drug export protein n=1 Tax=Draconibacterium halophilum TaxID=2706887 RepID=A0A6C0RHQ0_9BACT|nr:hypothetical protein [Draconibacterium halophilum]QIA09639.1 hypothetical protein G0Q07_18865 [Draconibacterium halophilum]